MLEISREFLDEIKQTITPANIMSLLEDLGGSPRFYNQSIIISRTICHDGDSHKLYYYLNTNSFYCYTNCGSFDIFGLIQKVLNIDFVQSVYYVINKFNLSRFEYESNSFENKSYEIITKAEKQYFERHKKISQKNMKTEQQFVLLKEFDKNILKRFMYPIIKPWEEEGIAREIIESADIGYYPGGGQITIPHYDKDDRLIGIRGRQLGREEALVFGKYRPLYINNISYAHPLGFNLYNLNKSKDNIRKLEKAIVFEGEKSTLKYASYYGQEYDISVASCGSAISDYQIQLLLNAGAKEICIAFDRQFKDIGDEEFNKLTNSLTKLNKKYHQIVNMSFIFDNKFLTNYKDSPVDCGPDTFFQLFKDRIIL